MPMDRLVQRVSCLAAALDGRLLQPGTCVGVLAAPSAGWVTADMAIMLADGTDVPFFVDFSASHFQYKIEDSGMKTIFVFGEALWHRFQPFAERFDLVITDQPAPGRATVMQVDDLIATGAQRLAAKPGLVSRMLERLDPQQLAVIIYTSGSTGMPKGVELSHRNLVSQLEAIMPLFPMQACRDRALSLLPLAHTFERIVLYLYLSQGMCVYFVDDIAAVGALMQEVHPTMMTVVPRLMEKTYTRIREKAQGIDGAKGRFARWTFRRANRDAGTGRRSLPDLVADRLVGWQVRKAFGGKLSTMVVGGAHMPDELNHFFVRMGLPIFEGYGLTEASPVVCTNHPGRRKVGTVGRPLSNVEVATTDEGEVLARGPNIMRGYRHMPDETARVIDADGWLHTGDLGRIDEDGCLTIVARQKELFKTSTGETVFPGPMEQALCRSDLVDMACVIAEGRKFTSCLLFLSPVVLANLRHTHGAAGKSVLSAPFIQQKIQELILSINHELDHWEKIHGYVLLTEAPSVDNGELTPTFKIRRHVVEEHYRGLIEWLYDETKTTEDRHEFAIGHC
jgi:long-chain acyl-CoA synthetase